MQRLFFGVIATLMSLSAITAPAYVQAEEPMFCAQGVECASDGSVAGAFNDPTSPCYPGYVRVCAEQAIAKQCGSALENHQGQIVTLEKKLAKVRKQLRRAKKKAQ